jgi:lysophospholipase L1-like esterase
MSDPERREPSPTSARRRTAAKLLFSAGLTLLLLELGCQLIFRREMSAYEPWKAHPAFYYEDSRDPVLVYELRHDYTYAIPERRVHVNHAGIRDDEEIVPARRTLALLGDSVVFGVGQTQDKTLSALLQDRLDPSRASIRVLNFGVPGYAVREVARFFEDKNAAYQVTDAVYLLNPNDFAWRDTRFEGADDGLYRLFHPPLFKAPLLLGKAAYRAHKAGKLSLANEVMVSVPWYEWLFQGNRDRAYDTLREMKAYAAAHHVRLSIVPLPAGCAYHGKAYALDAMYDDLAAFFGREGIPTYDARAELAVPSYFNETDHLTDEGNQHMADALLKAIAPGGTSEGM